MMYLRKPKSYRETLDQIIEDGNRKVDALQEKAILAAESGDWELAERLLAERDSYQNTFQQTIESLREIGPHSS